MGTGTCSNDKNEKKEKKRQDKSNSEDFAKAAILKRKNLTHQVNIASGNPADTNNEHFYRFHPSIHTTTIYNQTNVSQIIVRLTLGPSSDVVLHLSRIECKLEKSFVLSHLHPIRLM